MNQEFYITLFCPDCRGRFEVEREDIVVDELIECSLCGAEILVLDDNPIRIKLFTEEDDF